MTVDDDEYGELREVERKARFLVSKAIRISRLEVALRDVNLARERKRKRDQRAKEATQ